MHLMNTVIKVKIEHNNLFLKLNRPEKRNALNPDLIGELLSFFKESKWDSSVKTIVLSGEGKAFCSGADLKWMSDESAFNSKEMENLFSLFEAILSCPLPLISLVHGFAVGGGLGLLSVSDVVIAEENTQFQFSETKLGLIPSVISPFIVRKIGLSQAQFLMLSALPFSPQKAQEIGLSHFFGSQEECDIFLQKILNNFKQLDIFAVSKTKKWLNSIYSLPLSQVKKEGVSLISEARKSPSSRKRIKILLEGSKRK